MLGIYAKKRTKENIQNLTDKVFTAIKTPPQAKCPKISEL